MVFSDKNIEMEFAKAEKWIIIVAVPFFIIMSFLLLAPYPFKFSTFDTLRLFIICIVGTLSCFFSLKVIIYFSRKYGNNLPLALRLSLQTIISCIIVVSITLLIHFIEKRDPEPANPDFKNLLITVILFTFLGNFIYEFIYVVLKLSKTALETERYKNESTEAKYQNLTSRLNPHFLFNSLNTLATIIEEDSKKAVDYTRELSIVYRYVLSSHKDTWTDLSSELELTNSYIHLLKMRFEENIRVLMDISEKYGTYFILPLTIQLLIENAVKHNEISPKHPLDVKIYCNDEYLVVTNNKQKRTIMPSSTKVGLLNITERYKFLVNKEVIIEDTETTFTVKIPLVKITI